MVNDHRQQSQRDPVGSSISVPAETFGPPVPGRQQQRQQQQPQQQQQQTTTATTTTTTTTTTLSGTPSEQVLPGGQSHAGTI